MAKEEFLQFEGLVTEILPDARYRVQLDAGHMVVVYTAGRMKKNRIKTLAGDRVTVEISPYDLDKGRMIFRHRMKVQDAAAGSCSVFTSARRDRWCSTRERTTTTTTTSHHIEARSCGYSYSSPRQILISERLEVIWPAVSCRSSSAPGVQSAPSRPTGALPTTFPAM